MATVHEVVLRGYSPSNDWTEETVGIFATREQADKVADEIRLLWPEDREGLVPSVVDHEVGRIRSDWAIVLAEHSADCVLASIETSEAPSTDVLDAIVGGHTLEGGVEEEFREAYKAFFTE